jgi:mono/diheme cytochrome c family protein
VLASWVALGACAGTAPAPAPAPAGPPVLAADRPTSGFRAPAAPATGAQIFALYCAGCHGDDGTGGGRYWNTTLEPVPPSLVAGSPLLTRTDAEIADSIAKGRHAGDRSLCPPWGRTLSPREIDAIVKHLRQPIAD